VDAAGGEIDEIGAGRRLALFTGQALLRIGLAAGGGLLFLVLLQSQLQFNVFDPVFLSTFQRLFLNGLVNTLYFTAIVIPSGMLIGLFTGWARVTKFKFLSYPATAFADIVRGIPALVLVLFAYFFGPFILPGLLGSTDAGRFFAAMALALHTGAYQAEIFRAGFQSVPRGQLDAALSVGLSRPQSVGSIVLPQMFRLILPPLGNELATVLKDTSLLGAIGAMELFASARSATQFAIYNFGRFDYVFSIWTVTAMLYLGLTLVLSKSLQYVEKRYSVPGLGSVNL
jgi:polar amino acid transport system permease protein